jgi:XTP/dITP diphosphohydrolase
MPTIVFATNNAHKIAEVREILAGTGIEVRTLADMGLDVDPPETGDTFVANARQKARFVHEKTGLVCVADDSGLEVDALDGAPGVHSKRFSPEGTAAANNKLLLSKLEGEEDRAARFVCVIAVVGNGVERTAAGECEGIIVHAHQGHDGFGYDPIFSPDDDPERTMAELSMAQKNAISHRGQAFRQLPDLLEGLL